VRGSVKAIAQSKGEKPLYMTKAVKSVQGWQASREAIARRFYSVTGQPNLPDTKVGFKKKSQRTKKIADTRRKLKIYRGGWWGETERKQFYR